MCGYKKHTFIAGDYKYIHGLFRLYTLQAFHFVRLFSEYFLLLLFYFYIERKRITELMYFFLSIIASARALRFEPNGKICLST
jgi:hypothetical protein